MRWVYSNARHGAILQLVLVGRKLRAPNLGGADIWRTAAGRRYPKQVGTEVRDRQPA